MEELKAHPHVLLNDAEAELIMLESSGRPEAQNPKSTAFGLWQGLIATRIAYASEIGVEPDTTDPIDQVGMMRRYIENRYGTAEEALEFRIENKWY